MSFDYRVTDFSNNSIDSLFSDSEDSPIKRPYYNDGNSSCSVDSPIKRLNLSDKTGENKKPCQRSLDSVFFMPEEVQEFPFLKEEKAKADAFMNLQHTSAHNGKSHQHRNWKKVKNDLVEHTVLRREANNLKDSSEIKPLAHFNPTSLNAKDLYISDNVVFKPGKEEAVMSKLGYMVTWMAGLQGTVVPAKKGQATVISREDQNDKGFDKQYLFVRMGNRLTIVDNLLLKGIKEKDKLPVTALHEGDKIAIKINDDTYALAPSMDGFSIAMPGTDFDNLLEQQEFFQLTNNDDEQFAAPANQIYTLQTINGKDLVHIQGVYYVKTEDLDEEGLFNLEFATIEENAGLAANEGILAKQYQEFCNFEGNNVLVATTDYIAYDADEGELMNDGKSYTVEVHEGILTITAQGDDADDDFVKAHKGKQFLLVEQDAKTYLVKRDTLDEEDLEEASTVAQNEDGHMTVMRNNQPYLLEQSDQGIKIIGKEITGMMQSKVPNIFMGMSKENGIVDVVKSSETIKNDFYRRIPMNYFSDAVLASLLLRPQDGKIEALDESNVLFSAEANKEGDIDPQNPTCPLRPVLIDLDETMPANNDTFVTENGDEVCAVRLGLMGFPHAREALDKPAKAYILDKIQGISNAKDSLLTNLDTYSKKRSAKQFVKKENIQAFKSVISSLESFIKNQSVDTDWNIQSLCFAILPEYGRQWNEAMSINPEEIPPELVASVIGKSPLDKIKDRLKRSYYSLDTHK